MTNYSENRGTSEDENETKSDFIVSSIGRKKSRGLRKFIFQAKQMDGNF